MDSEITNEKTFRNENFRHGQFLEYLTIGWNLLVGLALNALFGWWSDSVAALIMLPIIIKEGVESLRGETCGNCH